MIKLLWILSRSLNPGHGTPLNRFFFRFITLFLLLAFFVKSGRAIPLETRASRPGAVAVGMGKVMRLSEYLADYPGARTALSYLKLDRPGAEDAVQSLQIQARIAEKMNRDFWPQIALETEVLSLAEFRRELAQQGSLVERNVRILARGIAEYRERDKWFFIRPFSEMNDATETAPWEFGDTGRRNTPQDFAAAWKLLRETFDAEGATNAIFIFSPLAAHNVHREKEVLKALNLIPPGYIDAFGMNLYSRPESAYGGASQTPIPFATLAQHWTKVLEKSRHRGIPCAIAEMGVSNQATDAARAKWLGEAFRYARSHNFVLLTYFNYPHRYWQIPEHSLTSAALEREMRE